jgi:Ser/Thr protein kinase RdoA (MazF antagonist)
MGRHHTSEVAFADLGPDTILDAVESLGHRVDGRLLELNSFENRVYQVGVEDESPVITKFYRRERWSDAQILEEHAFTLECQRQELPVVAPLVHDGVTLHRFAGYRFSLSPRRGGHAPPLDDPEALTVLGRFLGRLHNIGAAGRFQHRQTIDVATLGYEPRELVLDSELLAPYLFDAYLTLTDDLLAIVQDRLGATGATRIRLHGDFHIGNVLWRDQAPHVVDFDDTRSGPAVQDLWMLLPGEREEREQALLALLKGYTAFRDFDPLELGLIEPLRTLRLIHYGGWLARRHEEPTFRHAFPWLAEPRWWEEHVLTLREQLAALQEPALDWRPDPTGGV